MPNYALILQFNYQGTSWTIDNNDYQSLQWFNDTPKPTQEELDALWPSTQDKLAKDSCKSTAKDKLAASDWSVLPDVQITNKADFENYRAIVRGYVISPVANPTWPTEPQPIWG